MIEHLVLVSFSFFWPSRNVKEKRHPLRIVAGALGEFLKRWNESNRNGATSVNHREIYLLIFVCLGRRTLTTSGALCIGKLCRLVAGLSCTCSLSDGTRALVGLFGPRHLVMDSTTAVERMHSALSADIRSIGVSVCARCHVNDVLKIHYSNGDSCSTSSYFFIFL